MDTIYLYKNDMTDSFTLIDDISNSLLQTKNHIIESKKENLPYDFINRSNWSIDDENIKQEFRKMQGEIIKREKPILINLLDRTEFEMGFESEAEKYFNKISDDYGVTSDTILQNIYLDYMYTNSHILKHLLYIVAELPEGRRDNLVIIAMAGLSNPDIEIQDLSIRCFECWGEKKYIRSLQKIERETNIIWLRQYIHKVISELDMNGE